MEQGFCQPPTRQLWIMRSVQNSFLKKFLPHLIKEPREASKSVRCERVPEPRTGHDLSHAAPNLLIKAFVPELRRSLIIIENELHLNDSHNPDGQDL